MDDDATYGCIDVVSRYGCTLPVPEEITDSMCRRVCQYLFPVETKTCFPGVAGTVYPPSIENPLGQSIDIYMPERVSAILDGVEGYDLERLTAVCFLKQKKLRSCGSKAPYGEIGSLGVCSYAEREPVSRTDRVLFHVLFSGIRSLYPGISTFTGSTFHISRQYSCMARSEENFPIRAVFRIDIRVHRSTSR
ncbi:MAG: hypothetical protein A4E63_01408 [Syntrophorhabdus sp. PtaU1.Bin050]|nr:MAG: hypothetical protein A4E63_01408 [Syntrophorhabdus sp. PtaU1.Bin050]